MELNWMCVGRQSTRIEVMHILLDVRVNEGHLEREGLQGDLRPYHLHYILPGLQ